VAEGGVAKKKVDLLRRWSGTKGAQAAAGLPEPRPMSPAAAGKPRSPEGGAPSDAPEIELVQQDGGKVGPKPAPPVDEADDSSGQGRRLAPPRPPPLTITESMVDTSTGMARTPFDMPAHVRLPPQRVTSKAESLDDEEEAEGKTEPNGITAQCKRLAFRRCARA